MGYDQIAQSILHNDLPPHGYIVDVVETDELMFLQVYADDINSHADTDAEQLAVWLKTTLDKLNMWSTAKWTWTMAEKPK